jgi:predicted solute-binding protein
MANVIHIEVAGKQVEIDAELFKGYRQEAFEHLDNKNEADAQFKEVVETVAETTGLKKGIVSKYLKDSHAAKTKALKDTAEVYGVLDDAIAGV